MAESAMFHPDRPPRRKVFVLNRHPSKVYEEEFRGEIVQIPPAQQRKVVMDITTAEKFLSRPVPLAQFGNDGVTEISMGKPLYISELTEEEIDQLDPRNRRQLKREEEKSKNMCTICGMETPTSNGLLKHVQRMHPDAEPVKEL